LKKLDNPVPNFFQKQMNLIDYVNPGIYQITCLKLNKKYIGESYNVLARLGKHTASLDQSIHDSIQLQLDWNRLKLQN